MECKRHKKGLKHPSYGIFDHCSWSQYQKISFRNFDFFAIKAENCICRFVPRNRLQMAISGVFFCKGGGGGGWSWLHRPISY